ncbi:MAG: MerR family transcriptional regulator [Pseudomonadota bacterium]
MRKSADAFRTISEVADELDVPKHVLRFWEIKFPQIKPMKRGGGRRYYRPEDMALLSGIRELLHSEGYTIKGVQKILKEQGADYAKSFGQFADEGAAPASKTKAGKAAKAPAKKRASRARDMASIDKRVLQKMCDELETCRSILVAAQNSAETGTAGRRLARA